MFYCPQAAILGYGQGKGQSSLFLRTVIAPDPHNPLLFLSCCQQISFSPHSCGQVAEEGRPQHLGRGREDRGLDGEAEGIRQIVLSLTHRVDGGD